MGAGTHPGDWPSGRWYRLVSWDPEAEGEAGGDPPSVFAGGETARGAPWCLAFTRGARRPLREPSALPSLAGALNVGFPVVRVQDELSGMRGE